MLSDKCKKTRVKKSPFHNHQRKDGVRPESSMHAKTIGWKFGRNRIFTLFQRISHKLLMTYKGKDGDFIVKKHVMHVKHLLLCVSVPSV